MSRWFKMHTDHDTIYMQPSLIFTPVYSCFIFCVFSTTLTRTVATTHCGRNIQSENGRRWGAHYSCTVVKWIRIEIVIHTITEIKQLLLFLQRLYSCQKPLRTSRVAFNTQCTDHRWIRLPYKHCWHHRGLVASTDLSGSLEREVGKVPRMYPNGPSRKVPFFIFRIQRHLVVPLISSDAMRWYEWRWAWCRDFSIYFHERVIFV